MRILGVSGGFWHDPATGLVVDGRPVYGCEEERFSRQKGGRRQVAQHSLQACLDDAGLSLDDIDCIAFGWNPALGPSDPRLADSMAAFWASDVMAGRTAPPSIAVDHHVSHAALTYYTSGLDEAAVLVLDGQGETSSTSIFHGHQRSLTPKTEFPILDSLGLFFTAATHYLGFNRGGSGKTMGLAAYGDATYDFPEILLAPDGYRVELAGKTKPDRFRAWLDLFERRFGPPHRRDLRVDTPSGRTVVDPHRPKHLLDAAASAQVALERCVQHLVELALRLTKSSNVVLGGGVALNCTSNGRIRSSGVADRLFINGAAHDGGTALGAALAVSAMEDDLAPAASTASLFLGPDYPVGPTLDLARRVGLQMPSGADGAGTQAARLIADGLIGGWYQGRSEYGPRALGGRSIVGRPDDPSVAARVNEIKGREPWRPLAPAVDPDVGHQLGIGKDGLEFMVEARWVDVDDPAGPLNGIIHVDNSIRPLLVSEASHPFAPLLAALDDQLGVGAVINTSFNHESEPMVNSPQDALRTFLSTDLDFLVLGDQVLVKPV